LFNRPLDFVKNIDNGKHVVIFYEDIEYARTIILKYIENGLLNSEQCFFISANDDKEFIEREIQESINEISSKIIDINEYIKYSLLYVGNFFDIYDYPNGIENAIKDIINIIKIQSSLYGYNTLEDANKKKESKKIALKCLHKIETKEQIKNNILWEKNYRNTILRDALPNCSIICSYPINDILSTIKGESSIYSEWMADLLEIYDAVIYARRYWKGAAFNLI
jgi:hypothetical protein